MKVLVTGSRELTNRQLVFNTLDRIRPSSIVHGAARGADKLSGDWAEENNVSEFAYPAQWSRYGRAAGVIRNSEMLEKEKPDLVIAFLLPGSRGTADMVRKARQAGVTVKVIPLTRR